MFGWFKRPKEMTANELFADIPKTHYSRHSNFTVDFNAATRADLAGVPVQLYAAFGTEPNRKEAVIHFCGSGISVDALEANFNHLIKALRKAENGDRDY